MILVPVSIFPFFGRITALLPNNCRIAFTPLVSIFWILKMGFSCSRYDYKFNHLVSLILQFHLRLTAAYEDGGNVVWLFFC